MMKTKSLLAASALALLTPLSAQAALIVGQADVVGAWLNLGSVFNAGGQVDVIEGSGTVNIATDDLVVILGAAATLTDIDFTAPGVLWTSGGFTFTAESYSNITDTPNPLFDAIGTITGPGFDPSPFRLEWTGQSTGTTQISFSSTATAIPEPASLALLGLGLVGIGLGRRKLKKAS